LPPPAGTVQIWFVFVAKAILVPSGDQEGPYANDSLGIGFGEPPLAETV